MNYSRYGGLMLSVVSFVLGHGPVTQRPGPNRSKTMLSHVLDAQRQRTEDAWFAATTAMQDDAWVAGRDKDRRVSTQSHEPERRRPVITPQPVQK
jgi:hypothetical protein